MSAGAAAAIAAAINAIKAMGVVVRVEPLDFLRVLGKQPEPLVVYSAPTFFARRHEYLVSYKGFAFYTRSPEALQLPGAVELVTTKTMYVPS